MPKYCPECNHEIEFLDYSCDYVERGTETGSCNSSGEECDCADRNNCSDNDTDNYVYSCPNCNEEINIEDLLDEPTDTANIEAARIVEDVRYTQGHYETIGGRGQEGNNNQPMVKHFPSIECPNCHKANYRGKDDTIIICNNCNEEIIIN
jgi:hypothetical protein